MCIRDSVRRYPAKQSVVIRKPNKPVTPFAVAYTFIIEETAAPQAPPIIPAMKALINRIFTPKMAGSVIPIKAEREAGSAMDLVFLFFVFRATARAAAVSYTHLDVYKRQG